MSMPLQVCLMGSLCSSSIWAARGFVGIAGQPWAWSFVKPKVATTYMQNVLRQYAGWAFSKNSPQGFQVKQEPLTADAASQFCTQVHQYSTYCYPLSLLNSPQLQIGTYCTDATPITETVC